MLDRLCCITVYGSSQQFQQQSQGNYQSLLKVGYVFAPQQLSMLTEQLEEHRKNLGAVQHWINKARHKVLAGFNKFAQDQQNNQFIARFFQAWLLHFKTTRLQNMTLRRRLFTRLRARLLNKQQQNIEQIKLATSENCYERCLKAKVMHEWQLTVHIERKERHLTNKIKANAFNRLRNTIEIGKAQKYTQQLAESINRQRKTKKYFNMWVHSIKMSKITSLKLRPIAKILVEKLRQNLDYDRTFYRKFYNRHLLRCHFLDLKQNYLQAKSIRFNHRSLLRKYFRSWQQEGSRLFYQKQEETRLNQLCVEYARRRSHKLLMSCYVRWKRLAEDRKDERRKINIASQYGMIKARETLLRVCFGAIRSIKEYNLAERHWQARTKRKVVEYLKLLIIKSSQKWENLYKFVEDREKRKYFHAIKLFILEDKQKVERYRLRKGWEKFTFAIVKIFLANKTKSEHYHAQNLKFKTLFALKSEVDLKKKLSQAIVYINANLTLRRWRKQYKIRQFAQSRNFIMMGNIFRQLKLLRMNKIWSEPEIGSHRRTQKKPAQFSVHLSPRTETSIYFDKIEIRSPSKLASLDYSISAYDSNKNFDKT